VLVIGGSLMLAAPALTAQDTNGSTGTNALPLVQTVKYQLALEDDRALGEHALLPPGLKEKLKLTDEQRTEMKPIEKDFAEASRLYQKANQPRIDAAEEATRQARTTKSTAQIESARKQLQQVWAGLQPDRVAGIRQIKPLLTPDQIVILGDENNQWHESHVAEANDPSAN
jgi:hypothetical protein